MSTIFEELRGKYEARFSDNTLPQEVLAHKTKTSELLSQIKDSLTALSQIDVGFQQAAKLEEQKSTAAAEAAAKAKNSAAAVAAVAPQAAEPAPAAAPSPEVPPASARSSGQKGGRDSTDEVRVARRKAMVATGVVVAIPGSSKPASSNNQLAIQQ